MKKTDLSYSQVEARIREAFASPDWRVSNAVQVWLREQIILIHPYRKTGDTEVDNRIGAMGHLIVAGYEEGRDPGEVTREVWNVIWREGV